jgi:ornithine cyclodeaminase/alanine dehydrogenase-like protein (mu-crystallin family)
MHHFKIEIADNVVDAVQDSDVICTVTASKEPLVSFEHIKPGCHINAVGASTQFFCA